MKILWVSNSPAAPSGYGTQTRQVGRRLRAAGHELVYAANDGSRGDFLFDGCRVLGSGEQRYSLDTIREDVIRTRPDLTVVLYDVWVFTEGERTEDPFEGVPNVAAWCPVDHYPVPPTLLPWLTKGYTAIAMSEYGRQQLQHASDLAQQAEGRGFPVLYAPHAVDRSVIRPTPEVAGGRTFRELIGVPQDAYLVGIVAANIGTGVYDRKGLGDMAQALGVFMARHPDAHLYVHSGQTGENGLNLPVLLQVANVPADRLRWADQHMMRKRTIPDALMAAAYTSFDVLLGTSRGEGFGLPHLEAQACGTPVILSNWTASTELVAPHAFDPSDVGFQRHPSGWLVDVDPDYDPRHGAFFGKPRVGSILRALEEHHALDAAQRGAMRDAALANAARWDADDVFARHWLPIVGHFAAKAPLSEPVSVNRAARRQARRKASVAA